MGSGIGSLDDVYDTTVAYEKGVSRETSIDSVDHSLNVLGLPQGFTTVCTQAINQPRRWPCVHAIRFQGQSPGQ